MDNKKLYYQTLLCGALLTGASTGIFSNSIAVFITPVCADLGFSRGNFTLISSVTLLFSMAVLPIFGKLLPKSNLRILIAVCSLICSGGVLLYSFCSRVWQFYLIAALYGLSVNGITLLTVGMLLRRLGLKAGGIASGLAFSGAGIFSFFFLPQLQAAVSVYGWRWGYRLQAAVGGLILLAALMIMPKPALQSFENDPKVSLFRLIRLRSVLYAAIGLFIANAVNLALFNHSAANLTGIGLSAASAAAVTSRAALLSSVSKPLFGISLDKLGLKAGSVILSASLLSASVAAVFLPDFNLLLFIFPLLLSFSACSNSITANVFASRLFPEDQFSSIASLLTLASTAGSAIGPPIAGAVFDRFGNYTLMWIFCAFAAVLSGVMLILSVNHAENQR